MSAISRFTNFWEFAVFGPLMAAAPALSMAATGIGAGISAAGTLAAGANAQQMGQFQQQEYEQQAETATATGQRAMLEDQRQGQIVGSQLQARAAASGASATSPSTINLAGRIAGRSEYDSLMNLSQGENQAAGLTNMGDAAKYQGDLSEAMAPWSAAGTLAGGAGSMFRTLAYKNPSTPLFGGGG
jgi:hypothetical protein